jgi:hypothetical protein
MAKTDPFAFSSRILLAVLCLTVFSLPLCGAQEPADFPLALPLAVHSGPQAITDPEALAIIHQVEERMRRIRGITPESGVLPSYLDTATLRRLVREAFDKTFPTGKKEAYEQILKSLQLIPADLDILEMYLSLLDEQVGGLYDQDSKRLFVREGFDIAESALARTILAHEICHALQDAAFGLKSLGLDAPENDDLSIAILTIAEGDASLAMGEYAAIYEVRDILKDIPEALTMDQSALLETPHFFQQQLLFPYIQGQLLMQIAVDKGLGWRDRIFLEPPRTTEQVMHPEKYFDAVDEPSPLGLLEPGNRSIVLPEGLALPAPPAQLKRIAINRMGEFGMRTMLEERLGVGIASDAARGWDGDAYVIHGDGNGAWWFCWETAWDSPRDAAEFQGAIVTHWRAIAGDRTLGDLREKRQTFTAGDWQVTLQRGANRLIMSWGSKATP